jgi:hypothetical protein
MRPEGLSLKYSSDFIGNRTRDLPVCSGVGLKKITKNFGLAGLTVEIQAGPFLIAGLEYQICTSRIGQ